MSEPEDALENYGHVPSADDIDFGGDVDEPAAARRGPVMLGRWVRLVFAIAWIALLVVVASALWS